MYNLTDINTIKTLIGKNDFRFSKSLGQNFIIDPDICPEMAASCGADKNSLVIEIGPGIGVLTQELSRVAGKVVSIEIDKQLLPILDKTLSECENVKIITGDVMKLDLNELIESERETFKKVFVCANLPYYITSPIIIKLIENKLPLESITVMVQKEAADRLCAEVGSRQAGAVTVAVNYRAQASKLFDVPKTAFMPSPKVDSAVIKLDMRDEPPVKVNDEEIFFKTVRAAFGQRRKTAVNSLSSGLGISKEKIAQILTGRGFDLNVRAETMTMEDFANISNLISG